MATTSEMTVMFLPGFSGTTTRGTAHFENGGLLPGQAGPVAVLGGFPVLQLDHDLDALLLPHRAHPEQRRNVDQADAADFHVVRGELMAPTDEHVMPAAGHLHDVVGDQSVPSLDQVEHTLALADSGAAHEEQAHAVHVGQGAVQGGAGGERLLDDRLDPAVELGGLEPAAKHRDALRPGELEQLGRHLLAFGDEDAGQIEAEERGQRLSAAAPPAAS